MKELPVAFALKRLFEKSYPIETLDRLQPIMDAPVFVFDLSLCNFDNLSETLPDRNLPFEKVIFEFFLHSNYWVFFIDASFDNPNIFIYLKQSENGLWKDGYGVSFAPDNLFCGLIYEVNTITRVSDLNGEQYKDLVELLSLAGLCQRFLQTSAPDGFKSVPHTHRRSTKRGKFGWSYKIVDIDPLKESCRALAAGGGTHASPRWHMRMGHWRTYRDGRKVWVRPCEVGDKTRGGVVKDYRVLPAPRPPHDLKKPTNHKGEPHERHP